MNKKISKNIPVKKKAKLATKAGRKTTRKAAGKMVELFPFGVVLNSPGSRPILIMKDKTEQVTMPVWLTPTDASLVLAEVDVRGSGKSPHDISNKILSTLGCGISKCVFTEVIGHQLYAQLFFTKESPDCLKEQTFRFSADQVMSFCLNSGVKFYSERSLIEECKQIQSEILSDEETLWNKTQIEEVHQPYLI